MTNYNFFRSNFYVPSTDCYTQQIVRKTLAFTGVNETHWVLHAFCSDCALWKDLNGSIQALKVEPFFHLVIMTLYNTIDDPRNKKAIFSIKSISIHLIHDFGFRASPVFEDWISKWHYSSILPILWYHNINYCRICLIKIIPSRKCTSFTWNRSFSWYEIQSFNLLGLHQIHQRQPEAMISQMLFSFQHHVRDSAHY